MEEPAGLQTSKNLQVTLLQDTFIHKELVKVYLTKREKAHNLIKQENGQTRNLLKELITTVKDTSSQTRIFQLEASTMILS